MGLPIQRLLLPGAPLDALYAVRRAGHFDRVYSGPHSRWRTRWLARAVDADQYGPHHPHGDGRFLADVIAADVAAMGWTEKPPPPYGSRPLFPSPPGQADPDLPDEPYLIAHPGCKTGWETKNWPMDRWSALLHELTRAGWRVRLVGNPNEYEALHVLSESLSAPRQVTIHTDWPLWQLERAIATARGVVCHNSGIMHLALAYLRRTIVLTGSSAPYWRAPYEWVRNLTSGDCDLACNRYRCPVPGFRARCIRNLEVGRVVAACHQHWGEAPD
ncbi:lipopolysaccharide heptosyltransferase II [mine drainage metagenome]|uniref:Lipopolysaccharide heptosyltransferase II n=1 Tax=mine drainage metagenome TaxID=410659 RepID=T1BQW4_9ZZZZ